MRLATLFRAAAVLALVLSLVPAAPAGDASLNLRLRVRGGHARPAALVAVPAQPVYQQQLLLLQQRSYRPAPLLVAPLTGGHCDPAAEQLRLLRLQQRGY